MLFRSTPKKGRARVLGWMGTGIFGRSIAATFGVATAQGRTVPSFSLRQGDLRTIVTGYSEHLVRKPRKLRAFTMLECGKLQPKYSAKKTVACLRRMVCANPLWPPIMTVSVYATLYEEGIK